MEFNLQKALSYYEEGKNITEAAKKHCKDIGIEYSEKYRNRMSRYLNSDKAVDNALSNNTETKTNQYSNDKDKVQKGFTAISEDGTLMDIDKYCEHYGLDVNKIRSYKLISHSGIPFYNIVFYEEVVEPMVTEQ